MQARGGRGGHGQNTQKKCNAPVIGCTRCAVPARRVTCRKDGHVASTHAWVRLFSAPCATAPKQASACKGQCRLAAAHARTFARLGTRVLHGDAGAGVPVVEGEDVQGGVVEIGRVVGLFPVLDVVVAAKVGVGLVPDDDVHAVADEAGGRSGADQLACAAKHVQDACTHAQRSIRQGTVSDQKACPDAKQQHAAVVN